MSNREFDIIKEISRQVMLTPLKILFSWGLSKNKAIIYKDKPTLAMRVNGLLHKGWVYVIYNGDMDDYTVAIIDDNFKEKKSISGVYCDCLADVIDGLIEKAPDMTTEEYENEIRRQSQLN